MGEGANGMPLSNYSSLARWESEGGRLRLPLTDLDDQNICQILPRVCDYALEQQYRILRL